MYDQIDPVAYVIVAPWVQLKIFFNVLLKNKKHQHLG